MAEISTYQLSGLRVLSVLANKWAKMSSLTLELLSVLQLQLLPKIQVKLQLILNAKKKKSTFINIFTISAVFSLF